MLNLIKFRVQSLDGNGSGRDAYNRYAKVAVRLIEERGGRVIWIGSVDHAALHEGGDVDWDVAQLVFYPSRSAFIDMITSPEYAEANVDRLNGTEKHSILATSTRLANDFPQE
jgi:uncharacterized protein (DUF1330 family)